MTVVPGGAPGWGTGERLGRPLRHFPVAVSAEAQALAWARQEHAPAGAVVVVDQEVSARGRVGTLWPVPAGSTLACAFVLRPKLAADDADVAWLLAGLIAADAMEAVSGRTFGTWWPDGVVDLDTREELAGIKVEIQLGPGIVRSAVATMRFDLDRLGVPPERKEDLIDAVLRSLDALPDGQDELPQAITAAYEGRCRLLGERVKVSLRPKGEARGIARHVDSKGRLELQSTTGMVERITVDMLGELEVA